MTLYRQYNPSSDDHFYTASRSEAEGAVSTYGYCNQKSPGMLATSANDCTCGASLKPVFRLYRTGDHFYTLSESEADDAVSMYGYMLEGIAFYCSDRMNYCGATLPLYRYQRNAEHFYTTDPTEAQGTYEGITCYIWPCTQCQDFSTNVCQ